jgi:4-amino-4-deoxy-L-arabinose transferase-like glycosyltransferase
VRRDITFVFFAFSLLCLAVVPRMFDRGMFLDGITYAALARNLAEGRGSLWHPHYTETVYPDFHEQPTLGIGLQAIAFRVFGDHLFVERLYSFVVAVLTFALMMWTWHASRHLAGDRIGSWVAPVLWITAPVVSWALSNNMLEATQTMFALLAVGAMLESLRRQGTSRVAWGLAGGVGVAVAVLVKGPVGLFPLAAPWAYWVAALLTRPPDGAAERRFSRVLTVALCQLVGTAVVCTAVWSYGPARDGLRAYVAQQLRPTLTGSRETSAHRLRFAKTTAQEVLPMAVLAGVTLLLARRRGADRATPLDRHRAATFFLLGCAATVPLGISPKQSGHYVVPAMPMFALGFASLIASRMESLLQSARAARWARNAAVLLLTATALGAFVRWVAPWRDAARLRDLDRVLAVVPPGTTVHLCPQAQMDWSLHAYAQRLARISLDSQRTRRQWGMAPANSACVVPRTCRLVPIGTSTLVLYECGTRGDKPTKQ